MPDALQLLREDHNEVKDLFKQFEQADDNKTKQEIVRKALMELEIHSKIEEEIFYPALRKQDDTEDIVDEAEEEHHVVDLLMEELRRMRAGSGRYDAKFTVLSENVKHHIDEEETEMFPRAAEEGQQRMAQIGERLEKRKMELKRQMERGGTNGRSKAGAASSRRNGSHSGAAKANGRTTRGSASTGAGTRRTAANGTSGTRTRRATKSTAAKPRTTRSTSASGRLSRVGSRTAAGPTRRATTTRTRTVATRTRTTAARATSKPAKRKAATTRRAASKSRR